MSKRALISLEASHSILCHVDTFFVHYQTCGMCKSSECFPTFALMCAVDVNISLVYSAGASRQSNGVMVIRYPCKAKSKNDSHYELPDGDS